MKAKIKKIKVFVCDVDGVLTDGKIIYKSSGGQLKHFDVKDGLGLYLLKKAGLRTAIISARGSRVVRLRSRDFKADKLYLNASPKIDSYKKLKRYFKVKDEEVCFMGDDLPDLQVMKNVGFAACPKDAVAEIKREANYVAKRQGGRGAVREVAELILKTKGLWKKVVSRYL